MAITKPQTPIINWGHPLTQGLSLAFPFSETGGPTIRDIVKKSALTQATLSGTYNRAFSNKGVGINFDGATGTGELAANTIMDNLTAGTISVVVRTVQTSVGNDAAILGRINSSVSNGGFSILMTTTGTIFCQLKTTAGSTVCNLSGTISGVNDGRLHVVTVSYSQASGGSNTIYIDGKLDVIGTNSAAWTWNSANVLRWASPVDGFWSRFSGAIFDTTWWNRALSYAEVKSYAVNPWQIYKTPSLFNLNVGSAAAPATTYNAPFFGMNF